MCFAHLWLGYPMLRIRYQPHRSELKKIPRIFFLTLRPSRVRFPQPKEKNSNTTKVALLFFGGSGGNRTHVRKSLATAFYGCSCCIDSPLYFSQQQDKYRASLRLMTKAEAGLCSPLPLVDALSYVAVVIGKTSSIKLLRQLYCCRLF